MTYKREDGIEKKVCARAGHHTHDGVSRPLALKFVSPNRPGVPDRFFVREIPPEHREIVARYFRLREFKSTGKKPDPHQAREIAWWRSLGFDVDIIDDETVDVWA